MENGKMELSRAMTNVDMARVYEDELAGKLWGEMVDYLQKVEAGKEKEIPAGYLSLLNQSDMDYAGATKRMIMERFVEMELTIKKQRDGLISLQGKMTLLQVALEKLEKSIKELEEREKERMEFERAKMENKPLKEKAKEPEKTPEEVEAETEAEEYHEDPEDGEQPSLEEIEKESVSRALERNDGDRRKAAKDLHITLYSMRKKIRKYGLQQLVKK